MNGVLCLTAQSKQVSKVSVYIAHSQKISNALCIPYFFLNTQLQIRVYDGIILLNYQAAFVGSKQRGNTTGHSARFIHNVCDNVAIRCCWRTCNKSHLPVLTTSSQYHNTCLTCLTCLVTLLCHVSHPTSSQYHVPCRALHIPTGPEFWVKKTGWVGLKVQRARLRTVGPPKPVLLKSNKLTTVTNKIKPFNVYISNGYK